MKTIDKLLIIALGLFICLNTGWETPLPLIGLIPVIYALIILVDNGLKQDGY